MQAITYNNAIQDFPKLIGSVSDNHEPLIITHDNHKPIVLISLEDYNAWQETEYLTRTAANTQDLLDAVSEISQRKNISQHKLIEEWLAFVTAPSKTLSIGNKPIKKFSNGLMYLSKTFNVIRLKE